MTSIETQTPKPVSRRIRLFPAWLAILSASAAWSVAILALTVTRYLLANTPVGVNWTAALSNVALMSLLTIVQAAIGGWASGLNRYKYIVGSHLPRMGRRSRELDASCPCTTRSSAVRGTTALFVAT